MSPEKSKTMALLGQNSVRCTVIVDSLCLQQVKIFNIAVVKVPMKMTRIFSKN